MYRGTRMTDNERIHTRGKGRDWSAYDNAQVNEKRHFRHLLHELCRCVEQPEQSQGRPRLRLDEMLFCIVYKVYSAMCARRHMTDLREAHEMGFVNHVPHFNSLSHYLRQEPLTGVITRLIEISSMPLRLLEQDFAVDATGLATDRYARWLDERELRERSHRKWVKLHLMCGVRTHVVTLAIVDPGHESRLFGRLVAATARNFRVSEVSADKAYLSGENMRHAVLAGATPFIAFRENSRLDADYKSTLWKRLLAMFLNERWRFMAHYNKRNNVETTFSMIKAKFGPALRSRDGRAQINEALAKVLCHNLCVLIQAMYEFGLEPKFEGIVSADVEVPEAAEKPQAIAGGRIVVATTRDTPPGVGMKNGTKKRKRNGGADPNQFTLSFDDEVDQPAVNSQPVLF